MKKIIMHLSSYLAGAMCLGILHLYGLSTLMVGPALYVVASLRWQADAEYKDHLNLSDPPLPSVEIAASISLLVLALLWEVGNG